MDKLKCQSEKCWEQKRNRRNNILLGFPDLDRFGTFAKPYKEIECLEEPKPRIAFLAVLWLVRRFDLRFPQPWLITEVTTATVTTTTRLTCLADAWTKMERNLARSSHTKHGTAGMPCSQKLQMFKKTLHSRCIYWIWYTIYIYIEGDVQSMWIGRDMRSGWNKDSVASEA